MSPSGEGGSTPLQYSCLENPMDGGPWWATVHGVAKSRTWLSDFNFTFHFHASEKEMATHSSMLAWRIPGTGEPGGLPSMGSHRVGHSWSDLAAAAAACLLEVPGEKRLPCFSYRHNSHSLACSPFFCLRITSLQSMLPSSHYLDSNPLALLLWRPMWLHWVNFISPA